MYVNNRELSLRVETNLSGATNFLRSVRHFYSGFPRKDPALETHALPIKLTVLWFENSFLKVSVS